MRSHTVQRNQPRALALHLLLGACTLALSAASAKDGALQTSVPATASAVHGPTSQEKLKEAMETHNKHVGVALAAVKGSHAVSYRTSLTRPDASHPRVGVAALAFGSSFGHLVRSSDVFGGGSERGSFKHAGSPEKHGSAFPGGPPEGDSQDTVGGESRDLCDIKRQECGGHDCVDAFCPPPGWTLPSRRNCIWGDFHQEMAEDPIDADTGAHGHQGRAGICAPGRWLTSRDEAAHIAGRTF